MNERITGMGVLGALLLVIVIAIEVLTGSVPFEGTWLFSPIGAVLVAVALWFVSPIFTKITGMSHGEGVTVNSVYFVGGGIALVGLALLLAWVVE